MWSAEAAWVRTRSVLAVHSPCGTPEASAVSVVIRIGGTIEGIGAAMASLRTALLKIEREKKTPPIVVAVALLDDATLSPRRVMRRPP
jgi:hypothetical protein